MQLYTARYCLIDGDSAQILHPGWFASQKKTRFFFTIRAILSWLDRAKKRLAVTDFYVTMKSKTTCYTRSDHC